LQRLTLAARELREYRTRRRAQRLRTFGSALEVATGRIIAAHSKRRRRVEFLGFMNSLVAAFPDRTLHVILDNLNTHKKNERWLKKHTRCSEALPPPLDTALLI
jgi:hypothetical protein